MITEELMNHLKYDQSQEQFSENYVYSHIIRVYLETSKQTYGIRYKNE